MEIWEWIFLGGQGIESGSQFRLLIKNQLQKSAGYTGIYLSFCLSVQDQIGSGVEESALTGGLGLKYPWGLLQPKHPMALYGLFTGDRCNADPHWEGKEKAMGACVTAGPLSSPTPCADVIPNKFPQKKKPGNFYPKAAENLDMKIPDTNMGSTFSVLQRQTKSCLTFPCHGRSPRS